MLLKLFILLSVQLLLAPGSLSAPTSELDFGVQRQNNT
uniref:Alpha-gliadin n=1 Tax=Steinernema glaseri TaxID=37863 RepID=A0A1I7Z963_9BILA